MSTTQTMGPRSGFIEADALSRLLRHPEEVGEFITASIDEHHFRDPLCQKARAFIMQHREKHGVLPTLATVTKHTKFEASDPVEPLGYYVKELINRAAFYVARDGANKAQETLKIGNIDEAVNLLEVAAKDARSELAREIRISNVEDVDPRIERYETTAAAGGVTGVPLPWEEFTQHTRGWQASTENAIIARTGVGKTFAVLLNAHAGWSEGFRTGVFTFEMGAPEMHIRHDALISEVPVESLANGKLNPGQYSRWKDAMDQLRSHGGFHIIDGGMLKATTTAQVEAMVDRLELDIVFIDGAYFLRPVAFNPRWSKQDIMQEVANDVLRIAQRYKIPAVISAQLNRDQKKTAVEVDLANVYGSDAWMQNAHSAYALVQTKEDKADGIMRYSNVKHRAGPNFAAKIQWDLDDMAFGMVEFEVGVTSLSKAASAVSAPKTVVW